MSAIQPQNPTETIQLGFHQYLERRQRLLSEHLVSGIPDYAFALDQKLRRKLALLWPIRAIAKGLSAYLVPYVKQLQQMDSIAVGPQQFPRIHQIGQDCARTLGIGTPEIFIYSSPLLSAFTYATDDISPVIVLSSGIVDALSDDELKFVIGHESGHIHNLHGIYNTMIEIFINPLAQVLWMATGSALPMYALQGAVILFMANWSRAAEVTCDRAGLICCGNVEAAQMALAKLLAGGAKKLGDINPQAIAYQRKNIRSFPFRLSELTRSHPLIAKRIDALAIFANCDVFYEWRPEISGPKAYTKDDADKQCSKILSIVDSR
jgi:Zn-dependent protease with chaperone function